jgi:hypothetical protein
MSTEALSRLGAKVRGLQDRFRGSTPGQLEDGEVYTRVQRMRQLLAFQKRLARIAAGLSVLVAAAVIAFAWPRPAPLTFSVNGTPGAVHEWLAADQRAVELRFSDGVRADFALGSHGRVVTLTPERTALLLDDGRLELALGATESAAWALSAGPFELRPRRGRLLVSWDPEAERFEVVIQEGEAELSGPVIGAGRMLTPGQTLLVSVRDHRATITPARDASRPLAGSSAHYAPREARTRR